MSNIVKLQDLYIYQTKDPEQFDYSTIPHGEKIPFDLWANWKKFFVQKELKVLQWLTFINQRSVNMVEYSIYLHKILEIQSNLNLTNEYITLFYWVLLLKYHNHTLLCVWSFLIDCWALLHKDSLCCINKRVICINYDHLMIDIARISSFKQIGVIRNLIYKNFLGFEDELFYWIVCFDFILSLTRSIFLFVYTI